jgi:predicted nucleic acid-binding protein
VKTASIDRICIDASLLITHVMPDEESVEVSALLEAWREAGTTLVAPMLFRWECLNALRRAMISQRLTPERAEPLRAKMLALPVQLVAFEDRADEVWSRFVIEYDLPTVYDALYLAVADDLSCELWTEDHRLYRAVRDRLSWVRCASLEA